MSRSHGTYLESNSTYEISFSIIKEYGLIGGYNDMEGKENMDSFNELHNY